MVALPEDEEPEQRQAGKERPQDQGIAPAAARLFDQREHGPAEPEDAEHAADHVDAGAFVTYSNDLKQAALGVPRELLQQHGAVSEPVVRAMAEGARQRSGASWSAAITGIAGPDGGTPDKPVGTVWLALSGPRGTTARLAKYRGDRGQVRLQAAYGALQLLREALGPTRVP